MDKNNVSVTRKSTESKITVKLDYSPVKPDYRAKIKTPMPFLSHMIEHIVWRGGFNIVTDIKLDEFYLSHVVCEDLGICLGKAVGELLKRRAGEGASGYGSGIGIIDEALSLCAISFENRAYTDIDFGANSLPSNSEGMLSEDLITFLEGFAQGAMCTLHIVLKKGKNAHHIWEAIFRSFGIALGAALAPNPNRKNMTSGVAGNIEFIIE